MFAPFLLLSFLLSCPPYSLISFPPIVLRPLAAPRRIAIASIMLLAPESVALASMGRNFLAWKERSPRWISLNFIIDFQRQSCDDRSLDRTKFVRMCCIDTKKPDDKILAKFHKGTKSIKSKTKSLSKEITLYMNRITRS